MPPPSNLQVFPKNISTAELIEDMDAIAEALGVGCGFCHVTPAAPPGGAPGGAPPAGGAPGGAPPAAGGPGGAAQTFALDDKPEKKTARVMLKMTNDLNARIISELTPILGTQATDLTKVQCATCHRGVAKPEQISHILANVMQASGENAAVSKYRELRKQYYGAQAYDFSDPMLVRVAQESLTGNKPDEAMTWLKLNLEFYPNSSQTYAQMSQVYTRKGDRNAALQALEKAVALDPDNQNAKRQLDQLKNGGTAAPAGRGGGVPPG